VDELPRLGSPTPALPVSANGRRKRADSGRPPKPLPKKKVGVTVLKDSAPTRPDPDSPMSQSNQVLRGQHSAAEVVDGD